MKLILPLLSIFIGSFCYSQKIQLGPEIGMNIVKLEEQQIGNNFKPAWHAGVNFEYSFNDWLSLKSGLFYTQKHQSYNSSDTALFELLGLLGMSEIEGIDLNTYTSVNGRHSQNFLQIPILASFKWNGLSAYGGPYVGFMMSSRTRELEIKNTPFLSVLDINSIDSSGIASFFIPDPIEETYTESSNESFLKQFDYGLKFGTGYQKDNFGFNISYLYGLTHYRNLQGNSPKQNHKYFQFSINYMFGIVKNVRHASH